MTARAFLRDGELDQATELYRRVMGTTALLTWRVSVTDYARGRPITSALADAHDRQAMDHYALARAAGYATHQLAFEADVRHNEARGRRDDLARVLAIKAPDVPLNRRLAEMLMRTLDRVDP